MPAAPPIDNPRFEAPIGKAYQTGEKIDPGRYLINLEFSLASRRDDAKPREFSPSVQTYLRILGRNAAMEALQPSVDPLKYAEAQLAGGWCILKRAKASHDGEFPVGIFFDPTKITAEAVEKYPNMPWLYNLSWEDLENAQPHSITLEGVDQASTWPIYTPSYLFSPYVQLSRDLVISNVIVPLPERGMSPDDPRWEALITSCYSYQHPVWVLDRHRYCDLNNEGLILAIRDYDLPPNLLEFGQRNIGLFPDRDAALDAYLWDVMDGDLDYGSP